MGAGFLAVELPLDVRGLRPVLARGWREVGTPPTASSQSQLTAALSPCDDHLVSVVGIRVVLRALAEVRDRTSMLRGFSTGPDGSLTDAKGGITRGRAYPQRVTATLPRDTGTEN